MKVAYKVVDSERRSVFTPKKSIYSLVYTKGQVVKAMGDSFGVFCFVTEEDAEMFRQTFCVFEAEVIRVRPIGEKKEVTIIAGSGDESFWFYKKLEDIKKRLGEDARLAKRFEGLGHEKSSYISFDFGLNFKKPPVGTVCYPAVEVLT